MFLLSSLGGAASGQSLEIDYDDAGEFNFVRVQFDTYYDRGSGYGAWVIDFPDADENFLILGHPLRQDHIMNPVQLEGRLKKFRAVSTDG